MVGNNNLTPEIQNYYRLLQQIKRGGVSALFPDEFEYYLCAFELLDSNGRTVEYLSFPIQPNSISIRESVPVTFYTTSGGITTLSRTQYIPKQITLNGDFGRKFKILVGRENLIGFLGIFVGKGLKNGYFSKTIKTGYGVTKVLDNLLLASTKSDEQGNPYQLYFYNLAYGESYQVKILDKDLSQDMSSNMIWKYNISLKTIAPLSSLQNLNSKLSLKTLIKKDLIRTGAKILINSAKLIVGKQSDSQSRLRRAKLANNNVKNGFFNLQKNLLDSKVRV